MGVEKNIVAIELGSSSVRAIVGQKKPDGSLQILGFEKESAFTLFKRYFNLFEIRMGMPRFDADKRCVG